MRSVLLTLCFLVLSGCAANNGAVKIDVGDQDSVEELGFDPFAMAPGSVERYKIGVRDVLQVNVWGNPDLSLSVPVRPDGYISMPLVGDVKASELEAEALADEISALLIDQLRNPQVAIIVSQVNSAEYETRVRVTGAVRSPVSLPYARGMSILDVILEAGGVNEVASPNKAKLYRTVNDTLLEFDVNLNDILLRGILDTNFSLQAGDVLTVPERIF